MNDVSSARSFVSWLVCFAFLGATSLGCASAARADLPPGGVELVSVHEIENVRYEGTATQLGSFELFDVRGQPFKRAFRLASTRDPGVEWGLQGSFTADFAIAKGDVLLASFWMRCADSMTGEGYTTFNFEQNHEPYDKAVEQRVGAAGEWVQHFVPFRAEQDFAAGKTQITFRGGFDRQTIEVGGFTLTRFPAGTPVDALPRTRITYAGRAADAPWRKAALERIERIRKAPLTVRVIDAAGQPVTGVQVRVELKRHAFGFGSCVTVDQLAGASADAQKCREIIERYFNRVVFENDMKWPAMWSPDAARDQKLDEGLDWLLKRKIEVRGHNLHWPSWLWSPTQLRAYEAHPQKLREVCADRVTSAVTRFKGKLIEWDVVNEPFNNTDLLKILGDDVMVDWFNLANEADPQCRLFVNDFGIFDGGTGNVHRAHFFKTIQTLKSKGAPLGGIGIQSHFGSALPPPEQLLAVLDQFAVFGLPITSTELSLNVEDRAVQAEYLRDYMIALFSHEQVNGILLWGFWEGSHWRPGAALWTKDWTLRPIGQAWLDLVTKEWHTDETIKTNTEGEAIVRAFLGDYEITVTRGLTTTTTRATLQKAGATMEVKLP